MQIEAKDRPKVVALILVIVLVLAFAVRNVMQSLASRPAPPQAQDVSTATESVETAAVERKTPLVSVGPNGVNPFRMTVNPEVMGDAPMGSTAGRTGANSTGSGTGKIGGPRQLPGIGPDGVFDPMGNGSIKTGDGGTNPMQPDVSFFAAKLQGVLSWKGRQSAMVEQNQSTQILRIGDAIGGGYKISRIFHGGIEVARGMERTTVMVGQTLDTSGKAVDGSESSPSAP